MLSYYLYNSIIVTCCIQKVVNLVHVVDQIYFDQQSEKILQVIQNLEPF